MAIGLPRIPDLGGSSERQLYAKARHERKRTVHFERPIYRLIE